MAGRIDDEMTVGRAPGVVHRRLLDGLILLAPDMRSPVKLSSPADVVWALLAEPVTVGDLMGHLMRRYYAESESTIRRDLSDLLAELAQQRTLTVDGQLR